MITHRRYMLSDYKLALVRDPQPGAVLLDFQVCLIMHQIVPYTFFDRIIHVFVKVNDLSALLL